MRRLHSVTKVTADEIPWLLKMTNPSAVAGGEDGAARDIFADHDQFDAFWTLPIPQASDEEHSTPSTEEDFFGHGLAAWIADSDGDHPDFNFDDFMDVEHDASLVSSIVLSRMDEMVSNLSVTHERMRQLGVIDHDAIFDTNLAQMVFTTSNLQYFVWLYFQRVHRYHPILHPPSFDCETSSLPLVMSVFLFGSLFSAPFDSAISARSFFDVAEEYIFSHPDLRQILRPVGNDTSHASSTRAIEILQAALTIGMIQNSRNDQATRRRMRIERYPVFTTALFEAETSDVFEYQVSLEPGGPRPPSLAGSISLLLQDSWPGPDDESYRRVTPEILALIISSLGVVGVVARTNCLFPLSYRALLRAFMRWKSLWDAKMKESEAANRSVGFSKHAMEMWWLCVAVVKAQQSGDKSKYISNMAIDSFNSVNEFLTRYITTLSSHEGPA
uniref:Xylanolytic transcriptional activator regulatory domain-containing protein n=1 Tax=Bionectria ochroleuca TaxID=29856 RepID=A0A0B7JWJ0_BIOOC